MYGESLALLSAFCWAAGGILYRRGLEDTNIWTGNLIRTSVATIGFIAIMAYIGILMEVFDTILRTPELLFWLFFSAFFAFFIGDILYLEALKRSGVSRALPVSSTYPLFVVFLGMVIYGRIISIQVFLGSVLVVLAIYLISERNSTSKELSNIGILFALLSAISWSISITTIDYLVEHLPVEAVAGFRFLIAAFITSALISVKGLRMNYSAVKWLGLGGVVALIIGNYAFVEAIRVAGSSKVTPISAVYPVIAAVFAKFSLNEIFSVRIVLGIILSFVGVLLVLLF